MNMDSDKTHTLLESIRATKQAAPCVSIYLDTPPRGMQEEVASIALYRELYYARGLLETSHSRQWATEYLKPILQVAKEELLSGRPGTLALFHSGEISTCLRLPIRVPTQTVVADSFHVKPLLAWGGLSGMADPSAMTQEALQALVKGGAAVSIFDVAQALKQGKAKRLWVAEDVTVWGLLNRRRGSVVLHPAQLDDRDGDILDDFVEWSLDEGLETITVPRYQMPGQRPVVAELKSA